MSTCRFCKDPSDAPVKYGTRHYAHFDCFLDSGRNIFDLPLYQVQKFPFKMLKDRGLLAEINRVADEALGNG